MNKQDAWIQTFLGQKVNVFKPILDTIKLIDIAHALSNQCRFSGHVRQFYSIAEHSIHVSRFVKHENALKALLHDASEAYLVDVPRPIKPHLTNYQEIESDLLKIIFKRFGLSEDFPEDIHYWDKKLCVTEGFYLMPDISDWELAKGIKPIYNLDLKCWSPREAKAEFVTRFIELNTNM